MTRHIEIADEVADVLARAVWASSLVWISESVELPTIAEPVLLMNPRQSGEFWDISTARLLMRHEDVLPNPVPMGGQWPTNYYWSRSNFQRDTMLITGNAWWARLDKLPLPPGAEHAYGPAGLGGGHYVRQTGDVFIPQGGRR